MWAKKHPIQDGLPPQISGLTKSWNEQLKPLLTKLRVIRAEEMATIIE